VLVAARRAGLGQVRGYLVADLLRRWSERTSLAPTVIDLLPDGEDDLRAVCAELNIHPPRQTLTPPPAIDQLAGQFADGLREPVFDVGVRAAGDTDQPATRALARHWIEVAGAPAGGTANPEAESAVAATTGAPAGGTASTAGRRVALGEEPLSVRMKLMQQGYGEELSGDLSPRDGEPGLAAKELARWRGLVAGWSRSPSGALSRQYAEAVAAAFADDLDTAAALGALAALADDPAVPDGVKFETFAAADRLFGLDLARDVGRLSVRNLPVRNECRLNRGNTQRIAARTHDHVLLFVRRRFLPLTP
jgi:hypothetical protein